MTEAPIPLGVFVGGFRWSGSGAVSDWLAGHRGVCRPADSEASFGEVRALNYGLRYLAQTAAQDVRWGETLGRWALCPQPSLWPAVLGAPLTRERGSLAPLHAAADALFTAAARFRIIPGLSFYKPLLDAQLGGDFREDREYLQAVSDLSSSFRSFMRRRASGSAPAKPWEDDEARGAASRFVALMYRRLSRDGAVPIFDNAFSGLNPELFHLIDGALFQRRIIILVRRDPRDQFADLVKCSGSTFSWSAGSFISQYRRTQKKTADFASSIAEDRNTLFRLVNFESFVLDSGGVRTALAADLCAFWAGREPPGEWLPGPFDPAQSARNIGFWRTAGLGAAMRRIEKELPEFLTTEAESR
jgi:hypothetical protein